MVGKVDIDEFVAEFDKRLPTDAAEFNQIITDFLQVTKQQRAMSEPLCQVADHVNGTKRAALPAESVRSSPVSRLSAVSQTLVDHGENRAAAISTDSARARARCGRRSAELSKVAANSEIAGCAQGALTAVTCRYLCASIWMGMAALKQRR